MLSDFCKCICAKLKLNTCKNNYFILYYYVIWKKQYAPMVKWLRRCPLTAESGVRVPLGVPTNTQVGYFFVPQGDRLLKQSNAIAFEPLILREGTREPDRQRVCHPRIDASLNASLLGVPTNTHQGIFLYPKVTSVQCTQTTKGCYEPLCNWGFDSCRS